MLREWSSERWGNRGQLLPLLLGAYRAPQLTSALDDLATLASPPQRPADGCRQRGVDIFR